MEYDLCRVLYSATQLLEFHISHFVYQILCAIKYIHSAGVIHRDLKPGNILVSQTGSLKVCDFGLSRSIGYFYENAPQPITNYVATRWYRAPELLLRYDQYGKAVDMWAIGCIAAECYGRQALMRGDNQMHQLQQIYKYLGPPPQEYAMHRNWKIKECAINPVSWKQIYPFASDEGLDFIGRLLRWLPKDRMTVEQALDHTFVSQVREHGREPLCKKSFTFGREESEHNFESLKNLLNDEVNAFQIQRCGGWDEPRLN